MCSKRNISCFLSAVENAETHFIPSGNGIAVRAPSFGGFVAGLPFVVVENVSRALLKPQNLLRMIELKLMVSFFEQNLVPVVFRPKHDSIFRPLILIDFKLHGHPRVDCQGRRMSNLEAEFIFDPFSSLDQFR